MIRGNVNNNTAHHIANWKPEGQKASNGEWILLDSHNNEPTKCLQIKTFNVACEEKLKSIKLTQTGTTTSNDYYLHINAIDIFGHLYE